jgi:L,D-transpeptidase catalytic domain
VSPDSSPLLSRRLRASLAGAVAVVAGIPLLALVGASVAPGVAGAAGPPGPNSVVAFGTASSVPGAGSTTALPGPVVGIAATADGNGYWTVTSTGQVTAEGDAGNYGSLSGTALNAPIMGITATADAKGYWLVASDGGIFSFGDAAFYGSTGSMSLNRPVVGMAAVPGGGGYWLVASDGGIFSFGNAPFFGSTGTMTLAQPVIAMAPTAGGTGYWLLAADGGVFTFGASGFAGSGAGGSLTAPAVGIAARPGGYWIAFGQTAAWNTPLGQSQLLARLGYLPLNWSPLGFTWKWGVPPQLAAQWTPNTDNNVLKGAIWAFEAVQGIGANGQISTGEIGALLAAANDPGPNGNPNGYTYSLVQEHQGTPAPETITVFHTGQVVQTSYVNTGISTTPTTIGTFPVYVRYRTQVMTGTMRTGTHYADPVQFVSYFLSGEALHYMPRATYGTPQSLGCVEIPLGPASVIWQYTYLGSLVTVTAA